MRGLVIGLGLLLTACSSSDKHWAKAGGTLEAFNADSYDCATKSSAREASFSWQIRPSYSDKMQVNKDMYRLCLQSRGYQRSDEGQWVGVRD
jgi:hypothetical protein